MAWSMDSVLADILAKPEAVEILDKVIPGASKNPMIKMGKSFTLGKIAKTPAAKLPEAKIQEVIDALNAASV